jgi:hypothetical protein
VIEKEKIAQIRRYLRLEGKLYCVQPKKNYFPLPEGRRCGYNIGRNFSALNLARSGETIFHEGDLRI